MTKSAPATSIATLPPVVVNVEVDAPPERAFELFVSQLGRWWPLGTHSIAVDEALDVRALDARIEPRIGGRIYELWSDGQEVSWGRVLAYEPPNRLLLEWNPNRTRIQATEVEVRFVGLGSSTRVELEHRAWERLGSRAPGARAGYAANWASVLNHYTVLAAERR